MRNAIWEHSLNFGTIALRDEFINTRFPKRECQSTPGSYKVPGGMLVVRQGNLMVYGRKAVLASYVSENAVD